MPKLRLTIFNKHFSLFFDILIFVCLILSQILYNLFENKFLIMEKNAKYYTHR